MVKGRELLEVYVPGSDVRIGHDGEIHAKVLAVKLHSAPACVEYLVGWWDDASRHEV